MAPTPFYVAGRPESSGNVLAVTHPGSGEAVGETSYATPEQVEKAIAAAAKAAKAPATAAHQRAKALDHVSRSLEAQSEAVARLITGENGKPLKWARIEVSRAVSTFRWAAEEARRFSGDLQRLDTDPTATGRLALVTRRPKGPVLGISPFNFPLNLVAHKIGPAIAVGAPIVLKPAPKTPLSALKLGQLLSETDLPEGMFSVLPIENERAPQLVADERLPVVSFTGSGPVGWQIKDAVPRKHVTLELGGNAAAVVCADYDDLDWAATRIATFSNYQAGQSCIAVQRVIVHESRYDELRDMIVEKVAKLKNGDPYDENTDVGPMINEEAAERVERWVNEADAKILTGGTRDKAFYAPTVLEDVPTDAKVTAEEVFGPVLVLIRAATDDEAFDLVNRSEYGLQAGVFTRNLQTAFTAGRKLDVGGVIVGDVPSFRADQMPYGGVKGSGIGREGLRSAMDDYTEQRVLVLTGLEL
jgi:acyl-CoA reductase-like NAD-dependent aldehyde dehydrogenase